MRNLIYYGDGDSKSFQSVENIYEGVIKFECIGHYQKEVDNRLRKLKQRVKGLGGKAKKMKDEVQKVNGGKIQKLPSMRLTDALIDKLQNYFGIALRSNATALGRRTNFDKFESQHLSGAGSSPTGSISQDLNSPKLHYLYLTTRVAAVLVVR